MIYRGKYFKDSILTKKIKEFGVVSNSFCLAELFGDYIFNAQVYISVYDKIERMLRTYKIMGDSPELKVASLCFTGDNLLAIVTVDGEGVYEIHEVALS